MASLNPSNVDFLNAGNSCNLNCSQCYFKEKGPACARNMEEDIKVIEGLAKKFSQSSLFIYPMEIATSMDLAPLLKEVNQKTVLSNGIALTGENIDSLFQAGITRIKITLFANAYENKLFNHTSEAQYEAIEKNIARCVEKGLAVTVNNVLSKATMNSVHDLVRKCVALSVDRVEFIRLKPTGNARALRKKDYWMDEADMMKIISSIEKCKLIYGRKIHLGFNISFGVDFYGKTLSQAQAKVGKSKSGNFWTKSDYLCPAIGRNYFGISLRTGNIYGCFFAMDEEVFRLGHMNLESGKIQILKKDFLDPAELSYKLSGNCHKDCCIYQSVCLGGCRSTAYLFAKENSADPLFAGMDICVTDIKSKMKF